MAAHKLSAAFDYAEAAPSTEENLETLWELSSLVLPFASLENLVGMAALPITTLLGHHAKVWSLTYIDAITKSKTIDCHPFIRTNPHKESALMYLIIPKMAPSCFDALCSLYHVARDDAGKLLNEGFIVVILIAAIKENDIRLVKHIIDSCSSRISITNIANEEGFTALAVAALWNNIEIGEYLVKNCEANPNIPTLSLYGQATPLAITIFRGYWRFAKFLLYSGAVADIRASQWITPEIIFEKISKIC